MKRFIALAGLAAAALAATAAAGVTALSGTITADGSSTVGPYAIAAAEGFQKKNKGARVTVGISGTGGGFERFCRGETDLSNASRPMKNSEAILCRDSGVKWIAFTVANDGISVVVNKQNTWVDCLTTAELKTMWNTGSKVKTWRDVRSSFPDVELKLFGPGTDSGTFDFFTEVINGKSKASRSDYLATEDDNIIVQGVSGERGGLGYFGFSYYEENADKLKLVKVDSGQGCVAPSIAAVQKAQYKLHPPALRRPLLIYAKLTRRSRPRSASRAAALSSRRITSFDNEKAPRERAVVQLADAPRSRDAEPEERGYQRRRPCQLPEPAASPSSVASSSRPTHPRRRARRERWRACASASAGPRTPSRRSPTRAGTRRSRLPAVASGAPSARRLPQRTGSSSATRA